MTVAIDETFTAWLEDFGQALVDRDPVRVADQLVDACYWKDILAFGWSYRTFTGRVAIISHLAEVWNDVEPCDVRHAAARSGPRLVRRFGLDIIEAFFDFDTRVGHGTGFVRLLVDDRSGRPRAWNLLTTLQALRGFEEHAGERRPTGLEYARDFSGGNWLDQRIEDREYAVRDPDVLIVGGGQAGLMLAARFRQFGVDALVVEKTGRVGDVWRGRYHALTLHNEIRHNHMPYLPFPTTWPDYLPKDKLAGWLEAYSEFMDLNVWTATEFVGGEYDLKTRTWAARLEQTDGLVRTMHVRHIVLATGSVSGEPNIPILPGLDAFQGELLHSSQFTTGAAHAGRRAVVVGTGNSGHDIAQDLYSNGAAAVTLVQRGPTAVVSLIPSSALVYSLYSEGPPAEEMDFAAAATPYAVLRTAHQRLTEKTCALDRDLLDRLHAAGFRTDFGEDGTGFYMKYLRTGGGYYIDVGCAELIADRKVGIVQLADVDRFNEGALCLKSGTRVDCDVVVLATGYRNQQEGIRRTFGDEVADRVGPVWGFDEQHFMRNVWTRTKQDGLWITGGSLLESRFYSRFLALVITADLEGISSHDHPIR